ncbi:MULTISPECIES: restriction endonuclease [unclassified Nonomuraea]|uniref:nSTAND3 domain-containing NTPase n=1 Tax=unclassified Nonomuraea TaxID=2593643 RepID=UPI0033C78CE9
MDSFDLGRLTDHDFETVCRDLFTQILGVPLEIFPRGIDQGIDLRHTTADGRTVVVQCKHWPSSTQAKLIRQLEKEELPKVRILKPSRYVVATSVPVNTYGKDAIQEKLAPFVRTTGDIYGPDQIVEELRLRPEIVQRHFRLWLSSTAVMQTLLHQDTFVRSSRLRARLSHVAETFVPHQGFEQARRTLDQRNACIITGLPGVGKTTVACMLAAGLIADGYEVYEISQDVGEIDQVWRDDVPQLFLYDDFLGQTTLEPSFNKNEDNRLLSLLREIESRHDKAFIMTTRDYILEHARQRHGRLAEEEITGITSVVHLDNLTPDVRALILYHHVYYAAIPAAEKRRFAAPQVWMPIIQHRHFNPRIIDRTLALRKYAGHDIAAAILANLEDPRRIWEHIIENELSAEAVHILEVLFTFERQAELSSLEECWMWYRRALEFPDEGRLFRRALKVLAGTMVAIDEHQVAFHNPSVADYLRHHMNLGRARLPELLASIGDATQIIQIMSVATGHDAEALLNRLKACPGAVADAITTTMETVYDSPSDEDYSMAQHLSWILETAEDLEYPPLADYMMKRADNQLHSSWPSHLVNLARDMRGSPMIPEAYFEAFAEATAEVLLFEIEELLEGEHWPRAYETFQLAESLLTASAVAGVIERLVDVGLSTLQELCTRDETKPYQSGWITELLSFLSDHGAENELHDEFAKVERMLARCDERTAKGRGYAHADAGRRRTPDTHWGWTDVEALMNKLADSA